MLLRSLALLLLALPGQETSTLDPARVAKLRPVLQDFVDRKQASGLVAALGTAEGTAALEAVGAADLDAGIPMAKDTIFAIASMTKPITLIALMMLADEGKLGIDDAVADVAELSHPLRDEHAAVGQPGHAVRIRQRPGDDHDANTLPFAGVVDEGTGTKRLAGQACRRHRNPTRKRHLLLTDADHANSAREQQRQRRHVLRPHVCLPR